MINKEEKSMQEFASAIGSYIQTSKTQMEGTIETKYAKGMRFYNGEKLGNEREGFSQHVSNVTFNSVESVKARLLSCFNGAREIVKFNPRDKDDIVACQVRNTYMKHLFFTENNGYQILYDGIHNAALAKNATFRVEWKEKFDSHTVRVKANPLELIQIQEIQKSKGYELTEKSEIIEETPEGTSITYEATFVKRIDKSHVSARVIAPERFIFDPSATCLEDAAYVAEKRDMTGSDLAELGIDAEKMNINTSSNWRGSTAEAARNGNDASNRFGHVRESKDQTIYEVYDGYVYYDHNGDGVSELYRVLTDSQGTFLLDPNPVDKMRFITTPLIKIPHKVLGTSLSELLYDQQISQSMIVRQQMDHVARVNTGRYALDMEAVRNPNDVIDNNIGGLIDIQFRSGKAPIQAMPQDQLSPATSMLLEEIKLETETLTGSSRLSQGLNMDVVNHQNSSDLIGQMTNASTARVMMMARTFAECGLAPLFQCMFDLAVEFDEKPIMLNVGGEFISISPNELGKENEVIVDIAVTDEEANNKTQSLIALHSMLSNDPESRMLYTEKDKYSLLSSVMSLNGLQPDLYLQNPNSQEAQQTYNAISQQNQQMQQAMQQSQQMISQLQGQIGQLNQKLNDKSFENNLKVQEFNLDKADKMADNNRERAEVELKNKEINLKYGKNTDAEGDSK